MTIISLCVRCGGEGHLMHEGKYEGCPDCPKGRAINAELAAIDAERLAECALPEGDDRETVCSCGGDPDTCAANQAVIAQITAAEDWTGVYPS